MGSSETLQYLGAGGATLVCVLFLILWFLLKKKEVPRTVVKEPSSGELPREHWQGQFDDLNEKLDEVKQMIRDFLLLRGRDIADIKKAEENLLRKFEELEAQIQRLLGRL